MRSEYRKKGRRRREAPIILFFAIIIIVVLGFVIYQNTFRSETGGDDIHADYTPDMPPTHTPDIFVMEPEEPEETESEETEPPTTQPLVTPTPATPTPDIPTPATPTPTIQTPEPENFYMQEGGAFELPVNGASGYAAVPLQVYADPDANAVVVATLTPGQGFTILNEVGDWWNIAVGDNEGWVLSRSCFINLPDVVPSIIYNIANAHSSVKRSSGYEIPNITGYALYEAFAYNPRFGRYEFIVPVLYSTAKRVSAAQQAALADGNTIIVYEAFRPMETQLSVAHSLQALADSNPAVRNGINVPPWGIGWFVAFGLSSHQRGSSIDATLGRVISYDTRTIGGFSYIQITDYDEFGMPTPMHELSALAAILRYPVDSYSATGWIGIPLADTATEGAILLRNYFTGAGFTPLASEWWHFTDLEGSNVARGFGVAGDYFLFRNYSIEP